MASPLSLQRELHSVPSVSEECAAERLSPICSSAAVDRVKRPSPESQSSNLWVVVGVVIPVLVVTVIVVILYWKLCRTDKLDFQPDTVANIQQRQKVSSHRVRTSILMGQRQVQAPMLKDRGRPLKELSSLLAVSSCPHMYLPQLQFSVLVKHPRSKSCKSPL